MALHRPLRPRLLLAAGVGLLAGVVGVSCGARSSLFVDDDGGGEGGAQPDARVDARPDAPDAPPDVAEDVPEDVPEDALPDCNPTALFIYLVTSELDLYRFNPETLEFSFRGSLFCDSSSSPFSMGVNRKGRAYVVYSDGQLFRVNPDNATCQPTDFVPGQEGFERFGMGYSLDGNDERLYVAEISFDAPSRGLGRLDPQTLDLEYIGPFSENPGNAIELTGSDDGELYGYFLSAAGDGGFVVRIDKDTGQILEQVHLSAGAGGGSSLAFAYWGGDFYVFTAPNGEATTVTRYRPSDGTEQVITTLGRSVVGAGVSTCKIDD